MDLLSALVRGSKDWAQPIAASYASGNRVYAVRISRPVVLPTYDRDTGVFDNPEDSLVYDGPARIYPLSGGAQLSTGDEITEASSVTISIDSDVELVPRVDDLIEVVEDGQSTETHLAHRVFTVVDVAVGGHFAIGFTLTAVGAAPSRRSV